MAESDTPGERHKTDPTIEALMTLVSAVNSLHAKIDDFDVLKECQATIRSELSAHVGREESLFVRAFPDGDPDGHRRAHEAQILAAEKKAEFWTRMAVKAGEMTVWVFLTCFIAVLVFFWNGHMPASAQLNLPVPK